MQTTKLLAALVTLGVLGASPAQAGFVNQSAPPDAQPASKADSDSLAKADKAPEGKSLTPAQPGERYPKIAEVGARPPDLPSARGRADSMAVADVIPAIAPARFRTDFGDVNRAQPVSWSGGRSWPLVLGEVIAQMPGVTATIDWSNSTITLGALKPGGNTGPASERVAARWEVRAADLTLRQTLMRWAKDAGWQVSWEVKYDFPVQLEAVFGGTFENAIEQFTASLRNSEFPLLGCLYEGNRVVRVLHYGDNKGCDK